MRRPLPALALLATVVLVACGGDTLSAQEYRDQLNRTCQDQSAAAQRLGQPAATPEGFADFLRRGVEATRPTVDRAEALKPPEDLKDAHEAFVRNQRQTLEAAERLGQRVRGVENIQAAAMLIQQAPEGRRLAMLDAERKRLVTRLGASRCAQT